MDVTTELRQFKRFRDEVNRRRGEVSTLADFSRALKKDPELARLRRLARLELNALYGKLRESLDLPAIPVYLPVRKKIAVAGRAYQSCQSPREIRIYPIRGCQSKPYDRWRPSDITCDSAAEVLETFIHEVAHILEAERNGVMGHDQAFVEAYKDVEAVIRRWQFEDLDLMLRLKGVPQNSYAAKVRRQYSGERVGCLAGLVTVVCVVILTVALAPLLSAIL